MVDQFSKHRAGGVDVDGAVELVESFFDAVAKSDFAAGITQLQQLTQALGGLGDQAFLAGEKHSADPVERVVAAPAVAFLFALHTASDLVEGPVGQLYAVEGAACTSTGIDPNPECQRSTDIETSSIGRTSE